MPDQRSVMKEFRSLEQKRAAEGLTPAEAARHEQLRDLIGPEVGAGGIRGGFDVGAAAARLRDSLLPAGLRDRPAPVPEPAPEVALEPELSQADALADAYAAEPFAPLDAGAAGDALFDASELAAGSAAEPGAYDPAAGDPGAYDQAAYDQAAYGEPAAGWDPNAYGEAGAPGATPEWQGAADAAATSGLDPDAQPTWDAGQVYDPGAPVPDGAFDPGAAGGGSPGAAEGWDPNAPPTWDATAPFDPNAAFDPNAPYAGAEVPAAGEQGAPAAWDPNAQPAWDPNAPFDPGAPFDPNAPYAEPGAGGLDATAPTDPGAAPAWDASAPFDPAAPADAGVPWDPNAPSLDPAAQPAWDAGAQTADGIDAASVAFDAFPADAGVAADAGGWDPSAAASSALPGDAAAPWDAGALLGEPEPADAAAPSPGDAGLLPPDGWEVAAPGPDAAAAGAPLGEYDESGSALAAGEDAGLESMLPFDASAEAAAGEAAFAGTASPPALGEYDDTAGFSGRAFPDVSPADLPADGSGFEATHAISPAASEGWHPEPSVDDGFLLESGGSFDAADAAVAPDWAVGGAPPWEGASAPAEEAPGAADPAPNATLADAFAEDPAPAFPHEEVPAPDAGVADLPEVAVAEAELPSFDVDIDVSEEEFAAAAVPPDAVPAILPVDEAGEVGPAEGHLALDADAPEPDLSGPAPTLDFSRPDLSEGQPDDDFATPPASLSAATPPDDDLPTIDGEELLDEVPPEPAEAASPPALDFEPLMAAPATAPTFEPEPLASLPAPALVPPPPPAPAALVPPPPPPLAMAPPPRPEAPVEPVVAVAAPRIVEGVHRVVVHTVEGQVKRGVLEDADLAAASLGLVPQPGAAPELVAVDKVKAIFFMLAAGEHAPAPEGKKVRVTFRDGRQIAGFSSDQDETGPGFFMIPGDTRTNTGRIWVYRASVKQVVVS